MADVATLGLEVRSDQVEKGTRALDQLTNSAKRAQVAATGVSNGAQNAAAAINAEAAAANKAAQAMRAHGVAANSNVKSLSKFNTANIAAQFQDIAVSAQMGMGALQIGLQQGTQLAAVLATMENPVRGLGAAFLSVLSPVSLIVIGLTSLLAAGLQLVNWASVAASALNGLASILPTIAPYAVAAAAGLALLYAPAILGGLTLLSEMILGITARLIGLAAGFAMANPATAFVLGIAAAVTAAVIFRDELAQIFGVDIVGAAKTGVNYIIGSFVASFHDIQFIWNQLPNIVGAAAVGAANAAISAIQQMINAASGMLDSLIEKVNGALAKLPGGFNIGKIGTVDFGQIANPYADALSKANNTHFGQIQKDLSRDYLGDIGGAIAKGASAASAKLKELASNLTAVDDAGKKGKGAKEKADPYKEIVDGANRRIASLKAEQAAIGQTEEEALRLKYTQDLLNQAQQKHITLSAAQRAELGALAAEMAHVEVQTKAAKAVQDAWNEAGKGFGGVLKGLLDGTVSWRDALQQTIPIVLKLLNDMNVAGGGKGIFGGGFFQSLLGGLLGFARGGVFMNGNVTAFARGGVVNTPTVFPMAKGMGLMGEAGPEAVMPLRRGAGGRLGVSAAGAPVYANQNSRPSNVTIQGSTVVIQGNADQNTATQFKRILDERDRKMAKDFPKLVDGRNKVAQIRGTRP